MREHVTKENLAHLELELERKYNSSKESLAQLELQLERKHSSNVKSMYSILLATAIGVFGVFIGLCFYLDSRREDLKDKVNLLDGRLEKVEGVLAGIPTRIMRGAYPFDSYQANEINDKGDTLLQAEIHVLAENYAWDCESLTSIVKGTERRDIHDITREYVDAQLYDAKLIICLGTASAEANLKEQEEQRALQRMETLVRLVKSRLDSSADLRIKNIPVRGLNLGKFNGREDIACTPATLNQRKVVIIKVLRYSNQVELGKELVDALVRQAKYSNSFPIDVRNYSKFQPNMPLN